MKTLVKKMSSLKLLKVELIGGTIFSAIAMIGLPVGLFCVAPMLLAEPLAWGIVLCGMLFFGLVGYGLFVHPYRLYLKLPEIQAEYDDEFLYIHSKKEAKIPLAEITYVHTRGMRGKARRVDQNHESGNCGNEKGSQRLNERGTTTNGRPSIFAVQ